MKYLNSVFTHSNTLIAQSTIDIAVKLVEV